MPLFLCVYKKHGWKGEGYETYIGLYEAASAEAAKRKLAEHLESPTESDDAPKREDFETKKEYLEELRQWKEGMKRDKKEHEESLESLCESIEVSEVNSRPLEI